CKKCSAAPSRNAIAMDDAHANLIDALRRVANPARAEWEKSYQKSTWTHWGVALPDMDLAIRKALKDVPPRDLLRLSALLWSGAVWDLKVVATRILARNAVPASESLWRFVRARMTDLDGWAVADGLAAVGSRCFIADSRRLDIAEGWVKS